MRFFCSRFSSSYPRH